MTDRRWPPPWKNGPRRKYGLLSDFCRMVSGTVFWDCKGVILLEFLDHGATINSTILLCNPTTAETGDQEKATRSVDIRGDPAAGQCTPTCLQGNIISSEILPVGVPGAPIVPIWA